MNLPAPTPDEAELNMSEAQDVIHCVHIEKKIQDLVRANATPAQIDMHRANHRKTAYGMMSPAARAFAEKALCKMGILNLGLERESPTGFNVRAWLDRGAGATA